jgi:hypothetical protein
VKIGAVEAICDLRAQIKFFSVFYKIFCPFWIKFGTQGVHKNITINHEFHENIFCESNTLLMGCKLIFISFFIYCPVWVKFGITDLYILLLNICESHRIVQGRLFV